MTNTTPLITLAGIELLDLLPQLYGQVWAPRIVLDEYQAKAPPTEPDLAQLPWLRVVDDVVIDPALPLLDAGEAAALSLAQTIGARLLLLDERKARRIATRMGLPVAGTLAVLLRAKRCHPFQQAHRCRCRWNASCAAASKAAWIHHGRWPIYHSNAEPGKTLPF